MTETVKFQREVLFRIVKPYPYAGSVFRGTAVEQRPNGSVWVTGNCAKSNIRGGYRAPLGLEIVLHEKATNEELIKAGVDLSAMAAYNIVTAEKKAARDVAYKVHEQEQAAAQRVREAGPELLAALQASTHILHTPPPGEGPCKCGQCAFVKLRNAAIAKAIGVSA